MRRTSNRRAVRASEIREPDYTHPLMMPLAKADDAVARLEEAKLEMSSEAVADLRARMSYLEAAGWLRHAHVWIHPRDLGLRDFRVTSSYTAAAFGGHLGTELSSTVALKPGLEIASFGVFLCRSSAEIGAAMAPSGGNARLKASGRCRGDAQNA